MSDQPIEMEVRDHQSATLDANKQTFNELGHNAVLEAVVGGKESFVARHPIVTIGGALATGGVVGAGGGFAAGWTIKGAVNSAKAKVDQVKTDYNQAKTDYNQTKADLGVGSRSN